jgi:hypothetical protein
MDQLMVDINMMAAESLENGGRAVDRRLISNERAFKELE